MTTLTLLSLLASLGMQPPAEPPLLFAPVANRTTLVFVQGGTLWRAPLAGGPARSLGLRASPGATPRMSPDGRYVALVSDEAGPHDVWVVDLQTDSRSRVTYQPSRYPQLIGGWAGPDSIVFSAQGPSPFESELWIVGRGGGLPRLLPPSRGYFGAGSPDGRWIAFTPTYGDPGWRGYHGGRAPDIWLLDRRDGSATQLTTWEGTDTRPWWANDTLYYLSDAGDEGRMNIWRWSAGSGARQVTHLSSADIGSAAPVVGTNETMFESDGRIYLFDKDPGNARVVNVALSPATRAADSRVVDASRWITGYALAPGGKSLALAARGDVWILDLASSQVRNLTRTSGAHERDPAWSPDGRRLAWFSDADGEYDLYVAPASGGEPKPLTSLGPGFRYEPTWSPDGDAVAFTDRAGRALVVTLSTARLDTIARDTLFDRRTALAFSPDGRAVAYTRAEPNGHRSVWLFDRSSAGRTRLTSGFYSSILLAFAPDGRTLYATSTRDYSAPLFDATNRGFAYRSPTTLIAIPLDGRSGDTAEPRARLLDVESGRFGALAVTPGGRLVYSHYDPADHVTVRALDPADGPETELPFRDDFLSFSPDGWALLPGSDGGFLVTDLDGTRTTSATIPQLPDTIDVRAEWRQIFDETWRLYRDFYHDPGMGGIDWPAVRERFRPLVERAETRSDLNHVLGLMVRELSASHAGGGGGDLPTYDGGPGTGTLGGDLEPVGTGDARAVTIARVYDGASWNPDDRSPLTLAGARAGDVVRAIGGVRLAPGEDPWRRLVGSAGRTVRMTLQSAGGPERIVDVVTLRDDTHLRYAAWVERNRREVDSLSAGRVGYVHIPAFDPGGLAEFLPAFYGQIDREAMVIDTRWSFGGTHSDRFLDLLDRPELNHFVERDRGAHAVPLVGHRGPKVLLINHNTLSASENFAYYFRRAGLGSLMGTRTWGGLVGSEDNPGLIDGGYWSVPQVEFRTPDDEPMPEGIGLEPDVLVPGDSAQLPAAVHELLAELRGD